jgi:hypothetical protein
MSIVAASDSVWGLAWVGFAAIIILVTWLYVSLDTRRRRRRDAQMPGIAAKINASYEVRDDTVLHVFPASLPFFPHDDYAAANHVMRGTIWDVDSVFFDLQSVSSAGDTTAIHEQTVAMFHFGPGGMPAFRLTKWGKDTRFQKAVGMHDRPRMTLRGDPAFSDKFRITTDEEPAMQALLTAKLCRFIDEHDAWDILSTGTWIAVAREGVVVKPEDYHAFVGEASEFLRAFGTRG